MDNAVNLNDILVSIINIVIIPIFPVITAFLVALIKKKTQEIEAQIKNKELVKYIDIAENAVISAVTAVNQVYVDSLKKANGSLTAYEQKVAFEMARERVIKTIGITPLPGLQV